jgi:hypothetical protein
MVLESSGQKKWFLHIFAGTLKVRCMSPTTFTADGEQSVLPFFVYLKKTLTRSETGPVEKCLQ